MVKRVKMEIVFNDRIFPFMDEFFYARVFLDSNLSVKKL